ncbi:MAG: RIP metalloprotease RseP [Phenylobacterium sp.]|jgi:regulator of sigma E protease|uniref:RIP metalloprotease RseP n=1 Tax=Phenylobacterium sp. TaxID=1871053 RepID=UPI0025D45666|nr:RIP metalloprotease RseP [Phenylobacterium sp.]MCA3710938.1 RIP metalloprotease RseP [Phenylobacterium sp.]MCA3714847.1 RIP metalloprotease RseP [Phenylobacterium sp.]MCA3726124.1 RIP metalloprotease RseP [Phenylobacterium sp.]MCA3734314.1 RIP metalloprotease RseP [Phenylobacterium sp.]MCA6238667.1 RIP metalloprotease RseP [Phenylobacterium sp.]
MEVIANFIWHLAPFILVLSLVVTIHELGHFLAARACGVAVERFSIGFGRALFSRRDRSGVEWRVGWIPLGGYVMFAGDPNVASVPDAAGLQAMKAEILARSGPEALARHYHFKPVWQRALVTAAGPAANFLLAIVLFAALFMAFGERTLSPRIGMVEPGGVAEAAGFRKGDLVVEAAGRRIGSFQDLVEVVQVRGGASTDFVVNRDGREIRLTATPEWRRIATEPGAPRVGRIGLGPTEEVVRQTFGPLEAVAKGVDRTWRVLTTSVYALGRMITGQMSAEQLNGPLGIAQMSGQIAKAGAEAAPDLGRKVLYAGANLIALAAVLSVGIGFMNLLPIPVLDGGHLLFYAYEAVARRPLAASVQAAGYRVGLALVLALMLFATWNDLQRLQVFQFFGGLFS